MTIELRYQQFDPSTCGFPQPRVPVLPALGPQSLSFTGERLPQVRLDAATSRSYVRGRYALADAYRLCGVGPSTAILAPAYHCRTMLDPAIHVGAEVKLYPMQPSLAVDLSALRSILASCQFPVKALLATHFFGFVQPLDEVLAFCQSHGIYLIEDCCHCAPAVPETYSVGKRGRYSVWSPYKFYACEDGGTLLANKGATLPTESKRQARLTQDLKAIARAASRLLGASASIGALSLSRRVADQSPMTGAKGLDRLVSMSQHSNQYQPAMEGCQSLASSRWVIRHTATGRLSAKRRHHFQQWVLAVAELPHCRALYPNLPDGCVPYMFPLYIEYPDMHFYALKRLGVPVWRWDDMAVSSCAVATDYRLHLLHLPCHQELSEAQMAWMVASVIAVMTRSDLGHVK